MRVLVERRTRGLGDAVMLTSTVASLRNAVADPVMGVSISDGLLPVFLHNPHVDLLTTPELADRDVDLYVDCSTSAAAHETENQPRIRKNRPQLWAEAGGHVWDRSPPTIYLSRSEWGRAQSLRRRYRSPVIGVGYASVDRWRNYPHIDILIRKLRKRFKGTVIVFHDRVPNEAATARTELCVGEALRDYFTRVAACDVMVSPDTAHVHVAGALGVPVYFIDGPTDGKVRMDGYTVDYVRPPRYLECGRQPSWYKPCNPCWCLWGLRPGVILDGTADLLRESTEGFVHRSHRGLESDMASGEGV